MRCEIPSGRLHGMPSLAPVAEGRGNNRWTHFIPNSSILRASGRKGVSRLNAVLALCFRWHDPNPVEPREDPRHESTRTSRLRQNGKCWTGHIIGMAQDNLEPLTIRPRPHPDESLWGFIWRVAQRNGLDPLFLLNSGRRWPHRMVQHADIPYLDWMPERLLDLEGLATRTGVTVGTLVAQSFVPVAHRFHAGDALHHRRFMRDVLDQERYRYCAACLRIAHYHRRLWQVTTISACPDHHEALRSVCPHCGKPLRRPEIRQLDECPACGGCLTETTSEHREPSVDERWWVDTWEILLAPSADPPVDGSVVAMRLLYWLNDGATEFDRRALTRRGLTPSKVAALLQRARGTLSQPRLVALGDVLAILRMTGHSMAKFLAAEPPAAFQSAVRSARSPHWKALTCIAPWCPQRGVRGGLERTGTHRKEHVSGEVGWYYLRCPVCACMYARDAGGHLQERTPFGRAYPHVAAAPNRSLRALGHQAGLTRDQMRRCRAYFQAWGLVPAVPLNPDLLARVIRAHPHSKAPV